jgi:hypothetical protein
MPLEDELIGIRRRRSELERALRSVDDPSAIALIRLVIDDMSARIVALEEERSLRWTTPPSPPAFQTDL